jgi:folate-binding protein YgfZ
MISIRPDRSLLRLAGKDRLKWLQGIVTGELTTMSAGQGCFTAACNRQGKMVGVMVVHLLEDHILLEVDSSNLEPLRAHFDRYIIMEDVQVTDLSHDWEIRELHGPGSWEAVGSSPLPWNHHAAWKNGLVSGNRTLGEEGVTLLLPKTEVVSFPEGTPEEYDRKRIQNGFPKWGVDMGPDELPMEAGLEPLAISYGKGCYLGQEVILRVRNFGEPPKRLVLLRGATVVPGSMIRSGEEEIGAITSGTDDVALGYVKKGWKEPGTKVVIEGTTAIVEPLPWQKHAERPPDRAPGNVSKV